MKSILLHVHDDAGQAARLQAALDLARLYGAHLTCLQAMPFAAYAGEPFTGAVLAYETYADEMQATRETLEKTLQNEGVAWDWVDTRGSGSVAVLRHSQLADLIVLSPGGGAFDPDATMPIVGQVAVNARTPVLVVRDEMRGLDATLPVLIAWNGSLEAARALRACREIVAVSRAVHLLCIEEDADMHLPASDAAVYLSRHGIAADVHSRDPGGAHIADIIQSVADEVSAGMIVMGAYGRSRLYEFVLGGVTRAMLKSARLPLLLAH